MRIVIETETVSVSKAVQVGFKWKIQLLLSNDESVRNTGVAILVRGTIILKFTITII